MCHQLTVLSIGTPPHPHHSLVFNVFPGADPGFSIGGAPTLIGGSDNLRHRHFLVKSYVKTKEFGLVGGGGMRWKLLYVDLPLISIEIFSNVKIITFGISCMLHAGFNDQSTLQSKYLQSFTGADPEGVPGAWTPLTTKNEAPAPKFYKIEAPEWQF